MRPISRVRFNTILVHDTCIMFPPVGTPIVVRKGSPNSAQSVVSHIWTDNINPNEEVVRVRI